ncbi:MAG: hypothetical protein KDD42_03455, partial [Bdellovibrionales bacterium]|nr:hypothetical protein [Bdellovibrionales bacterium]
MRHTSSERSRLPEDPSEHFDPYSHESLSPGYRPSGSHLPELLYNLEGRVIGTVSIVLSTDKSISDFAILGRDPTDMEFLWAIVDESEPKAGESARGLKLYVSSGHEHPPSVPIPTSSRILLGASGPELVCILSDKLFYFLLTGEDPELAHSRLLEISERHDFANERGEHAQPSGIALANDGYFAFLNLHNSTLVLENSSSEDDPLEIDLPVTVRAGDRVLSLKVRITDEGEEYCCIFESKNEELWIAMISPSEHLYFQLKDNYSDFRKCVVSDDGRILCI